MRGSVAIIVSNKKILLFLRDNVPAIPNPNCWSLPGGRAEKGEVPIQTITRELKEEVGQAPENLLYLGYYLDLQDKNRVDVFFSRVDNKEANKFFHTGQEGQEIRFFNFEQLFKINLTPSLTVFLFKYQKHIKEILEDDNLFPDSVLLKLAKD